MDTGSKTSRKDKLFDKIKFSSLKIKNAKSVGKINYLKIKDLENDSNIANSISFSASTSVTNTLMRTQKSSVIIQLPINIKNKENLINYTQYFGKNHGLQGNINSCYLDTLIMSMFAFTSVFDFLLYRQKRDYDIKKYVEIQECLRNDIVQWLRKSYYVDAKNIMKFRQLIEDASDRKGFIDQEQDPAYQDDQRKNFVFITFTVVYQK